MFASHFFTDACRSGKSGIQHAYPETALASSVQPAGVWYKPMKAQGSVGGVVAHRTSPRLMRSPILDRLMRKPALATASTRVLASTLVRRSVRGAGTCSWCSAMGRVSTVTFRTCACDALADLARSAGSTVWNADSVSHNWVTEIIVQ